VSGVGEDLCRCRTRTDRMELLRSGHQRGLDGVEHPTQAGHGAAPLCQPDAVERSHVETEQVLEAGDRVERHATKATWTNICSQQTQRNDAGI
jgi:hypothetical protein